MPLSPHRYQGEQTRAFMRAFCAAPANHPVALRNPGQLAGILDSGTWQWAPGVRSGNAFIRTPRVGPAEYWVAAGYVGYRAAFLGFLESEFGLLRSQVGSTWHVDHILNAAMARRYGLGYLRVALVQKPFNEGYGRVIEKRFTSMDARGKSMYLLDYILMMKLLHIEPPASKVEYMRRRREIARVFLSAGFEGTEELVLMGLDGMVELWDVL